MSDFGKPDAIIVVNGSDPYAGDQLGRLALSKEGLAKRDRLVFELCRGADLPVATVMSGGYGRQIEDTVDIHLATVRIAAEKAGERASGSVLASDAFFPFPDGVERATEAGVTAFIQPGGSRNDGAVIEAADKAGATMVVTGARHFRH